MHIYIRPLDFATYSLKIPNHCNLYLYILDDENLRNDIKVIYITISPYLVFVPVKNNHQ
jgi:hypothetical protein